MHYSLTEAAQSDLIDIYDYGADTWGEIQAEAYFCQLHTQFQKVSDDPLRHPLVTHIKPDCRRSVFGSHSIYFEIGDGGIVILAILRSQDTARLR